MSMHLHGHGVTFTSTKSTLMFRLFPPFVFIFCCGMTSYAQYASDWNPDADGDNAIGVNDLLALLSVFEETDSDNDGIFDSQDDCVGVYDACGVCNGPGPTVLSGDSIVCPVYGCLDEAADNFSVTANWDDGSCLYGPAQCGGASTVTFDGYTYDLVAIGNQCWFKENLRSEHYANGSPIPLVDYGDSWWWPMPGIQCFYNLDSTILETHGRLYNWYAVNDSRGLCPSGWKVPSDEDWIELEIFLGLDTADALVRGSRGVGISTKLKSSPSSTPGWNGNNETGFSALPGGYRWVSNGNFGGFGAEAYYWTSTASGSSAFYRVMNSSSAITRNDSEYNAAGNGFSVRCLKD